MKRFTGMFLALAFLMVGTLATAAPNLNDAPEEPKITSETVDYKAIKLQLVNLQKETTVVKLEDMSGTEYYKRIVKDHNGFARRLDLNELDNGRYMLKIERNGQEWVQVVLVEDDGIRLSGFVSK